MKARFILAIFAVLIACVASSHGQQFAGQSGGTVRVIPPYRFCLGPDNGTDACFIQNGSNMATFIGALTVTGGLIPGSYTVATLPLTAFTGAVVSVTDALTQGSCTVGGGTALASCRWSGSAWQPLGGGGTLPNSLSFVATNSGGAAVAAPLPSGSVVAGNASNVATAQSKPVIDVRDYGVKGDGTTDDTTAMQNAANAACNTEPLAGTRVALPNGSRIKVSSTIVFSKCWGVTLEGQNSQGQTTDGANSNAAFVWAGSAGGTVLEVDKTRDSRFANFSIAAGTANIGLLIDEIGTVTTITTNNIFDNLAITSSGSNSSWIGIDVCPSAPGNCEAQNFQRLLLTCGGGVATLSNNGIGVKYEITAGAEPYYEELRDLEISNCSTGIDIEGGFNFNIDGGLMGSNYTDLLLNAGRIVRYANFRSESAVAQIVIGNASASGLIDARFESLSFSGLTNSTTTISYPFGTTGGKLTFLHLQWDSNGTVIPFGHSGAGAFSGNVVSINNTYPNQTNCLSAAFASSGFNYISIGDGPYGACYPGGVVMGAPHGILGIVPTVFGNVAACGATGAPEGSVKGFTDSKSDVIGQTITGSGAKHVLGYCNGTNWIVASSAPTYVKGTSQTTATAADVTCGTGGTIADCSTAQTITGLSFTLPLIATNWAMDCDLVVGQATAATANQWLIQTATNGATNTAASYTMATAATASAFGALTGQGTTTTAFQIAPSWTLGGTATKMPVHIHAYFEGVSVSGTVINLQVLAPTVADLLTIYRGSSCSLHP